MPKQTRLILFDTVVLSNFAFAGMLGPLRKRYARRGAVTAEVLDEIASGITAGNAALGDLAKLMGGRGLREVALSAQERPRYIALRQTLGSGEASCVAIAEARKGVVATDDRQARTICADLRLPVTGTIGILQALCVDKSITPKEADRALSEMIENGFFSPVQRISDLLP